MPDDLQEKLEILSRIVKDLEDYHPRAALLFGSMARFRAGIDEDAYHNRNRTFSAL